MYVRVYIYIYIHVCMYVYTSQLNERLVYNRFGEVGAAAIDGAAKGKNHLNLRNGSGFGGGRGGNGGYGGILLEIGFAVLHRYVIRRDLKECDDNVLARFLNCVEDCYCQTPTYHNSEHAASVTHHTLFLMKILGLFKT